MGGLFGVISKQNCITDLFYGTDYHSHLGTRRGGMASLNINGNFARTIHNLENSHFRAKFEDDLKKFDGYSGVGVISDTDPQPIILNSHLGKFAIVTVGKINNIAELESDLLSSGRNFTELSSGSTNPTELTALLITGGKSFLEGIEIAQSKIKGSCSFLLLTENGILASRDKYGRTPLILGKKDGSIAIASETCSFSNLGYEEEYCIGAGEVVKITAQGYEQLSPPKKRLHICSFLWIYYGYPTSSYEKINVDDVRFALGHSLGEKDDTPLDVSSAIPDSGTCMAIGFAAGKKIPFRNAIVKYTPTWPRSFMPSNQSIRDLVAKMKLIPNKSLLREKRIAFCDDSIVRGTQLKDNAQTLISFGAKEIHIRISCPPLVYPCDFLNFSASRSPLELITRRYILQKEGAHDVNLKKYSDASTEEYREMTEFIRDELGLSSLKFNSIETLVKAIGLPKSSICTHCFDGTGYED
ncbi:MAG: amidophosphoribosyltransferase [Bacteroidetes bacterium GWF2_41_61]|nr:MAG: amidophosphoribosyltransferase [Bacteroidetes bacterium GWF2_41_61]OFY88997.1 MAG: amidophosphoribosyltransferase [Bacteroidetes bacterium RIFOXYA12_FULL_40_10]HBG24813.1 amidophosphoribosyltransferase [Rikenellaceae bacterium]